MVFKCDAASVGRLEMVSLLCLQEKHAQEVRRNKELREALTA